MRIPLVSSIARFLRRGAPEKEASRPSASSESRTPRTHGMWPLIPGEGSALRVAAVYRCVALLSESVASLPVRLMRRSGEIFRDDTFSSLHTLLNVQPDRHLSAFDFWRQVVTEILLDGNAYIVPFYDASAPGYSRLALCERGTVAHDTLNDRYTVSDIAGGVCGVFDESEIIHIKGRTFRDPKRGVSVLRYAALTVGIATTGDTETRNRFANGGNVRGLVSNDSTVRGFGEYQDAELDKTAASLDERFQSGERIVGLPGQVDFKQISLSSTDMQFLESRKFTVIEICRFFGVNPSFVFSDTSNNYKSAEQASVAFLTYTLNPLLRSIEAELQRKLIAPAESWRRRIEFDRRGLYTCDLASRVKYQANTIAAGIYTVNDWRKAENQAPVEYGDKVLVSANLKPIEELHTAGAAKPENDNNDNEQAE